MAGKIFYQAREKDYDRRKPPRYQLVGLPGLDIKPQRHHLRMSELRFLAEAVEAERVMLPREPKHTEDEIEVG